MTAPDMEQADRAHAAAIVGAAVEQLQEIKLIKAICDVPPNVAGRVMVAMLDEYAAGSPDVSTFCTDLRADAEWWADFATPAEIEAFTAAGLRRITRKADFGIAARKRLLAELWNSMQNEDQRKFLSAVDPNGQFKGRAA